MGTADAGLLTIEGKLVKGTNMEDAENAIEEELFKIKTAPITEAELQKVKNKTESIIAFEDMTIMSRASSLANYELLGDASLMNTELEKYQSVTADEMHQYCNKVLIDNNSNTMYYNCNN